MTSRKSFCILFNHLLTLIVIFLQNTKYVLVFCLSHYFSVVCYPDGVLYDTVH